MGKSTLVCRLTERLDAMLSVSATTRLPGPDEREGKDYAFIDRDEFARRIEADEFLEHAEYLGNLYGTPAQPVREAIANGRVVILEIEMQGGLQVAAMMPEAAMVFILPPNAQTLIQRIQGRGRDTREVIEQRLANAQREIQAAQESDKYQHFIVNDELDEAVEKIVQIVDQRRRACD